MTSYYQGDRLSSSGSDSDDNEEINESFSRKRSLSQSDEEETNVITVHSSSSASDSDDSNHGNMDANRSPSHSSGDSPNRKKQRTEDRNSTQADDMQKLGNYSSVASKLMSKMGYKPGMGLGKAGQGRVDIIPTSKQRARRGLGLKIKALDSEVVIDWEDEKPPSSIEEVDWMPHYNQPIPDLEEMEGWEVIGKKKLIIEDETIFCDKTILHTMLECKTVFDDLEGQEMRNARMRSNPYETIRGAFFLNRAAMKMANMDFCFDSMFTKPKDLHSNQQLYFADICAGPGGFSEYVLWRKKWKSKGFGFTLKGENDFKLEKFFAANPEFFETHYGVGGANGDGDIMKAANIEEFQNFVLESTNEEGVHFVMADGGFSVEGQENIQEILTKQLLLCQFACALSILRNNGSFVCKTFDLFTPFSVGLVYLLRMAFTRISIFKPVTSRPANSERYVVCDGYRDNDRVIYTYLMTINDSINELRGNEDDKDVKEVVPLDVLLHDTEFFEYFKSSNERIANEQCRALAKIHAFAKDRDLLESRQTKIREDCLRLWGIPDQMRVAPARRDAATQFHNLTGLDDPTDIVRADPGDVTTSTLSELERVYNYRCYVSAARSSIIISLGGAHIFYWNIRARRWSNLTQINCKIPRDSILEVEIVQELKGEGKGQHRVQSLHVVDALVLAGDNIMNKNYMERTQCASMFVKAISKPSCPHLNVIRMKEISRFEEIHDVFDKISLKRVKGGGVSPRVCYEIPNTNLCFVPSGMMFIKFTKDPWSVAFSRSQKRKYFYNAATRQSLFECPPDFNASYQLCARSRKFWKWVDRVKIHPAQQHHRADLISSDQLIEFVQQRTQH